MAGRGSNRNAVETVLDGIALVALLATILAAPWLLGGALRQLQVCLFVGIAISAVAWTASFFASNLRAGGASLFVPLAIWPAAAFVAWASIQFTSRPLPDWLLQNSPFAVQASESPGEWGGSAHHMRPLSPHDTRAALARCHVALAALFLAAQLFHSPGRRAFLCGAVAVNAIALSIFGVAHKLSGSQQLYGMIPLTQGGVPFASFVNRNNAAGYLLTGCAAGLMLWIVSSEQRRRSRNSDWNDRLPSRYDEAQHMSAGPAWIWGLAVALVAGGVVASLSRGGIAGLACLLIVATASAAVVVPLGRILVVAGVQGAVLLAGLAAFGFSKSLAARWEQFRQTGVDSDVRFSHWSDMLAGWTDYATYGWGLGTYFYAHRPYMRHDFQLSFVNADNLFLELFVECGLPGLICVMIGVAVAALLAIRALRRGDSMESCGIAVAQLAMLAGCCVSAFFDFGFALPAGQLTLAVLLGAWERGLNVRQSLVDAAQLAPSNPPWSIRCVSGLTAVIVVIGVAAACRETSRLAVSERFLRSLPRLESHDSLTDEELLSLIHEGSRIAQFSPDDSDLAIAIGDLWMHRYRVAAWKELVAGNPGASSRRIHEFWDQTHPAHLLRLAAEYERTGAEDSLNQLRETPAVAENLGPARQAYLRARLACPWSRVNQLNCAYVSLMKDFVSNRAEAAIAAAAFVSPSDADFLATIGSAAVAADRTRMAHACYARSASLSDRSLRVIVPMSELTFGIAAMIDGVLPQRASSLVAAAELASTPSARHELIRQAERLLKKHGDDSSTETLTERARLAALSGQFDEAIELHLQAAQQEPLHVEHWLAAARLEESQGRMREAKSHYEQCLKIAPTRADIRRILQNLERKSIQTGS